MTDACTAKAKLAQRPFGSKVAWYSWPKGYVVGTSQYRPLVDKWSLREIALANAKAKARHSRVPAKNSMAWRWGNSETPWSARLLLVVNMPSKSLE